MVHATPAGTRQSRIGAKNRRKAGTRISAPDGPQGTAMPHDRVRDARGSRLRIAAF
jgi:hypothetical protein